MSSKNNCIYRKLKVYNWLSNLLGLLIIIFRAKEVLKSMKLNQNKYNFDSFQAVQSQGNLFFLFTKQNKPKSS